MTQHHHEGATPGATAAGRPLRGRRRWAIITLLAALLFVGAGLGALWLRLSAAPLAMPSVVEQRIEAALDRQMSMNQFSLGRISVALLDGTTPEVAFEDILLTDPNGQARAAFPSLRVVLSPQALLRGQVRPTRIEVSDAGLRLSRALDGSLDLELTQGEGATLGLEDTLDRIDTMFSGSDFIELEAITGAGLNVVMADAMTGQVMRVRDARMRLERKSGALTLTVGGGLEGTRNALLDLAITRSAPDGVTDLGMNFSNISARDLATASPALAWLDLMRAPISGRLMARLEDGGAVGDLSGQLRLGEGQISVDGVLAPLAFTGMAADFDFDIARQRMRFDRLEVDSPTLRFTAEGHADVAADGAVYTGQFQLAQIEAAPPGLFDAPVGLDGAILDLRLTLGPELLLEVGQAVVFADDLQVHADGRIRSTPDGVEMALNARMAQARPDQVLTFWPVEGAESTRRWIAENLFDAQLQGLDFALRTRPGTAADLALDFDFEAAHVRLMRTAPPMENGVGYLSLQGPQLVVRVDTGQIPAPGGGQLELGGSTLLIENTRTRNPFAEIDLSVSGDMQAVLRLLAEPPVNLLADQALTIDRLGQGQAALLARVETRFQRQIALQDIDFAVEGTISGFQTETLIPGRVLEAERLQVSVTPDAVAVRGTARLDGMPLNGQWGRALGPDAPDGSRVDARATLTPAGLAAVGLVLPDGLVSGRGVADLSLDLQPGVSPRLQLRSDLAGIGLRLPQLGWQLAPGQTGDLRADIRLGPTPDVPVLRIDAPGLSLEGRIAMAGGRVQRLVAERLQVGSWLDVSGTLAPRGAGTPPDIAITGGVLDLRGAPQAGLGGGSANGQGQGVIEVTLDRLQVTENIAFTALTGTFGTAPGLSGEFRGRVNGGAPITGSLNATEAGPAVRIRAEDGGAVLRAAGLLQNLHGGPMELILVTTGAPGSYTGQLTLDSPRLRNAPAMAELLNAVSVVGLLEQLGGDGINLGEVEARFRITPNQIRLTQGSALGPAIGVSMDGAYDLRNRQFDMQGVVSPLYAVNGLVGALFAPRREGLFGFSYQLTGSPDQTDVSVNPLSILTPGIFREIFRRPPPEPVETQ